jgi:hypothetical protein
MTYDSFGRKEVKRCHDGEQKRLLDSHDGDIDQRTDRMGMGRLSGVETGEAVWSLVKAGALASDVMQQVTEVMPRQYRWQDISGVGHRYA